MLNEILKKKSKVKLLVFILLLIYGNIQQNSGPADATLCNTECFSDFYTQTDFKSRTGLSLIHLDARSLISNLKN